MFTTLCWLFLATLPSIFGCWFVGKMRNSKETCYGDTKPLPPGLARAAKVPEHALVCLRHRRVIERQDSRCSSPFEGQHSKKLAEIPVSVYRIMDNYGKGNEKYRPGSKWCNACKGKFYKTTEGESGMAIKKRKKVTLISHLRVCIILSGQLPSTHVLNPTYFCRIRCRKQLR